MIAQIYTKIDKEFFSKIILFQKDVGQLKPYPSSIDTVDAPELVICIGDGPFLILFFCSIIHVLPHKYLQFFFHDIFFQTLNSILDNKYVDF